jgi:hypothetical protein
MKYLCAKTFLPAPAPVAHLISGAYPDKSQEPIASPRASQRSAEIKPAEYGCECLGRIRAQVPVSERGQIRDAYLRS